MSYSGSVTTLCLNELLMTFCLNSWTLLYKKFRSNFTKTRSTLPGEHTVYRDLVNESSMLTLKCLTFCNFYTRMPVIKVYVYALSDGCCCCKVTATQSSIINRKLSNFYKE